jgi:hypothetical protein
MGAVIVFGGLTFRSSISLLCDLIFDIQLHAINSMAWEQIATSAGYQSLLSSCCLSQLPQLLQPLQVILLPQVAQ